MSVHWGAQGPGHVSRGALFYPEAVAALDFTLSRYRIGAGGYFVGDPTTLSGWSFTRASSKTALTSSGAVVSFASGVPAITDLGFLPEQASTNSWLWSQQFDNAVWNKGNCSITANQATAPDGTLTADALVEDTTTSQHQVFQSFTFAANSVNTVGVFVRPAGRTQIFIQFATTYLAAGASVTFNLTGAGSIAATTGGATGTIQLVANGFYWVTATATSNTGNTAANAFIEPAVGGSVSYTGNGSTAFYLWQADAQNQGFMTSPIPTTSAAVTRAADALTLTYTGSPTTATVTYGSGTTATPSAASPLNLGASSGGAWVGNYVTRVVVK